MAGLSTTSTTVLVTPDSCCICLGPLSNTLCPLRACGQCFCVIHSPCSIDWAFARSALGRPPNCVQCRAVLVGRVHDLMTIFLGIHACVGQPYVLTLSHKPVNVSENVVVLPDGGTMDRLFVHTLLAEALPTSRHTSTEQRRKFMPIASITSSAALTLTLLLSLQPREHCKTHPSFIGRPRSPRCLFLLAEYRRT